MSLGLEYSSDKEIKGKQYAVIIGINSYDNNIPSLKGPTNDAIVLQDILQTKGIADYNVTLMTNNSSGSINQAMEKVCSKVKEEDTLLFYFSGHGSMPDSKNDLYMLASNSRTDRIRSTSVSGFFINELMSSTKCKNQIMILDCCNAGAFARSLRASSILGGRVIITSSSESGNAQEVKRNDGKTVGVFSHAFSQGILKGKADLNNDGIISIIELYQYCHNIIKKSKYNQETLLWALGLTNDIKVAKNITVSDSGGVFSNDFSR